MSDDRLSDRPVRVVIVGVGRYGALHARVWSEAGADLVGFVDIDVERLGLMADRFGVSHRSTDAATLLHRVAPDVVVIASDEASHVAVAHLALDARAHVLIEKPFALTSEDAHALVARADEIGLHVIAGHISRFAQPYSAMRAAVKEGRIGTLWTVRLRRDFSRSWFESFGARVHPVYESCIHDIDLAIAFAGARATRIVAMMSEAAGNAAPSVVNALVSFENGVTATIESAWSIPGAAPQTESGALELEGSIVGEAEVHGSAGVLKQRLLSDALIEWTESGVRNPDFSLWPIVQGAVGGALRAEIDYALAVVRGERANDMMPVHEAAWGIEIAEAMVQSLATGESVMLAPSPAVSHG
jgi:predicted dehydrogenase